MSKPIPSHNKKITWAAILNSRENDRALQMVDFFFENKFIKSRTKYSLIRMLLLLSLETLYNPNFARVVRKMSKKGVIKRGDLSEAIEIFLLYGMEKLPEELGLDEFNENIGEHKS